MPMEFLIILWATLMLVPDPINGSKIQSPSFVNSFINHSGRASGNTALWFLFAHSVAKRRTLVGYALSLPTQFAIFFPTPLPTLELSRLKSVSLRFFSLVLAQSPTGTITSSLYFFY